MVPNTTIQWAIKERKNVCRRTMNNKAKHPPSLFAPKESAPIMKMKKLIKFALTMDSIFPKAYSSIEASVVDTHCHG